MVCSYVGVCAGHPMLPGGVVIGLPRSALPDLLLSITRVPCVSVSNTPQCRSVLYHSVEDVKQSGVTAFGECTNHRSLSVGMLLSSRHVYRWRCRVGGVFR